MDEAASLAVDERSMFQKRESIVENAEVLAGTMTTMATKDTPQFAGSCKSTQHTAVGDRKKRCIQKSEEANLESQSHSSSGGEISEIFILVA